MPVFVGPPPPESPISAHHSRQAKQEKPKGLGRGWRYSPAAAALFDSWTTDKALDSGLSLREGNPVMAPIAGNDVTLYAIPAGLGLLSGHLADRIAKRGHRNIAKVIAGLVSGLHLGAGAANLHTIEREKHKERK